MLFSDDVTVSRLVGGPAPFWERWPRALQRMDAAAVIAVFLLIGLLASWVVAAAMAQRSFEAQYRAAFAETETLGRVMAARWAREMNSIAVLQRVGAIVARDALVGKTNLSAEEELQQALRSVEPDVLQVAVIRTNGMLLWSSLGTPKEPIDLSDRDHFRAIALDGKDSFSGAPVLGRVSGQRAIQLASAVRDLDGKLQAVVVVSVDIGTLRRMAGSPTEEFKAAYALFRNDGQLLMRSLPNQEQVIAGGPSPKPQYSFKDRSDQVLVTSSYDGVRRFISRFPLPYSDMSLAVGISEESALAPVRGAVRAIWLETAGLDVALLFAAAALLFAAQHSRALVEERIRFVAADSRQSLLRKFADRASDMIALYDKDFRCIYVNQAFIDAAGDRRSNPGKVLGERVVDEDRAIFSEAMSRLAIEGGPVRATYRFRNLNGEVRWAEVEAVRVTAESDMDYNALCYVAILRDVTDRKSAEARLIEAERDLNCIISESGGALYRDLYREGAPVVLKVVGEPAQSTIFGTAVVDMESPDHHAARLDEASIALFETARQDCARQGHATVEVHHRNAAGKWRWMRVQISRVAIAPDHVELLHFATDITDERESRLRREQTERLAVIGEVCAGIAHEMNQPLAVISMAAANGLLEMESVPFEAQFVASKFRRIEAQAVRIGKIIKHIRGFGRLELDQREYFAVADAIQDAHIIAKSRLAEAQVAINIDVAPDMPKLFGARLVLEQVLMNLFVNACDAYLENPTGGNSIRPRKLCVTAMRDRNDCVIRIADWAGGIRPELLDKIFMPFITTKAADHGTGLGLSYCAKAVHQMGGTIGVRNENAGAVFELRLPIIPAKEGEDICPVEEVASIQ